MVALKIKIRVQLAMKERKLGAETQLRDETNSVGVVKEQEDFLTAPQGDVKYIIKGQKAFQA